MQLALMKFDSMYEISECHLQSPFFSAFNGSIATIVFRLDV